MQSSSTVNYPSLKVPKTARKRKRKQQTENVRIWLAMLKRFFINSRWISLGFLALAVYALFTIAQEQRFYLTYIPVEGAKSITPERVAQASGLAGNHIFASDPKSAAKKIAEIPGVLSSTVTLHWPNEVLIQISEEAPIAVWYEGGVAYGITSSGRLIPAGYPTAGLLKIIPDTGPINSAVVITTTDEITSTIDITADVTNAVSAEAINDQNSTAGNESKSTITPTPTPAAPNNAAASDEDGAEALPVSIAFVPQEVLKGALQLKELRPEIEELYYRPYGGLSFEDARGWRGYFGTGTNMNQKIVIYETIVNDLLSRGIQPVKISVSNQEKPYYQAW